MKIRTKILWVGAGVLLIAAGIWCLCTPGQVIADIAYILGVFTLISGLLSVAAYFLAGAGTLGGGWMFADGLITVLLGGLLLANQWLVSSLLPYVFSMWIMVSGITRLILGADLRKVGSRRWWVVLTEGIICLVLGLLSLFTPVTSAVAIGILAGIFLILSGLSIINDFILIHRIRNYFKTINDRMKDPDTVVIDVEKYEDD